MKQDYTITIFSENKMGLLNKITNVFTKRRVNILSLTACESSVSGIARWTVHVKEEKAQVDNLIHQIEKVVEVLRAYARTDDEVVFQELILYKIPTKLLLDSNKVEQLTRIYNARILEITTDFTVIEHTGHESVTRKLAKELRDLGTVSQIARSGRIAVSRTKQEELEQHLKTLEERRKG